MNPEELAAAPSADQQKYLIQSLLKRAGPMLALFEQPDVDPDLVARQYRWKAQGEARPTGPQAPPSGLYQYAEWVKMSDLEAEPTVRMTPTQVAAQQQAAMLEAQKAASEGSVEAFQWLMEQQQRGAKQMAELQRAQLAAAMIYGPQPETIFGGADPNSGRDQSLTVAALQETMEGIRNGMVTVADFRREYLSSEPSAEPEPWVWTDV